MRISADQNDPGFHPDYVNATVFLNGRKLDLAVTADEEQRAVVCLAIGPDGHPIIEGDRWKKVVLVGDVEIRFERRR